MRKNGEESVATTKKGDSLVESKRRSDKPKFKKEQLKDAADDLKSVVLSLEEKISAQI